MPLYRITYELEAVVWAENEREAVSLGESAPWDRDGGVHPVVWADKVERCIELPEEWLDGIPYGLKRADDRTCRQILEAGLDGAGP